LESEINSHKAVTLVVVDTGHKLVQAGHFAAQEVATQVQQLEGALDHLQAEVARRRLLLRQALEAQQCLAEVREVQRGGPDNLKRVQGRKGLEGDSPGSHLLSPDSEVVSSACLLSMSSQPVVLS
jgi:hypothetical protein